MNLSFDDPSLETLDSSMSLHDPSDIDSALLSDIDGKRSFVYTCSAGYRRVIWLDEVNRVFADTYLH